MHKLRVVDGSRGPGWGLRCSLQGASASGDPWGHVIGLIGGPLQGAGPTGRCQLIALHYETRRAAGVVVTGSGGWSVNLMDKEPRGASILIVQISSPSFLSSPHHLFSSLLPSFPPSFPHSPLSLTPEGKHARSPIVVCSCHRFHFFFLSSENRGLSPPPPPGEINRNPAHYP